MSINFGDVPASSVLPIFWTSHDGATGANETMSALAVGDILVYKGVSMTQRASTAGYTLLDTDGIDVDSLTGVNGISVDLGDNTDAGFYAAGSFYTVVISPVTVDAQTVGFVAATFRIIAAEAIAGKPKVDVDAWLGTATATPTVAGVPEVDLTHVAGATTNVAAMATNVDAILTDTNELQTDWANGGRLDLLIDAIKAATDLLNAADSEPTGVPAANATPIDKLAYIYAALRNKVTVTATKKIFFDDSLAALWEKDLTDDGTTYTESEGNAP